MPKINKSEIKYLRSNFGGPAMSRLSESIAPVYERITGRDYPYYPDFVPESPQEREFRLNNARLRRMEIALQNREINLENERIEQEIINALKSKRIRPTKCKPCKYPSRN